jgi:MFS transporter, OPA family, glycerol-3-phosphate transporter
MPRRQTGVLVALLVAYGSLYLCRANLDAALPFLLREGYDKTSLGTLSSAAIFAYAVGKVALGTLADRVGGRPILTGAVVGSVAASVAFGLSTTFALLIFFAVANRFFQAGGWPGLVHIVSRRFEPARHGRTMGVLSTSYELGNVCALTLSGIVARWGWHPLFVVNPALLALLGGAAVLLIRPARPENRSAPGAVPPVERDSLEGVGVGAGVVAVLLRSRALWTTVALSALLTFIRVGFLSWTPTYLSEISHATNNAQISTSIVKSAVFPAAGVIAALSVGPLSDRLGPGRRAPIIVASLAVVVVLVLALAHGGGHFPVALIFGIGLFLLGPYSLLAGAIALDVGGKRGSATAAGIIDGAGYLGATAAPYVLGRVTDRAGWPAAFDVVAAAAAIAVVVSGAWAVAVRRR